MNIAFHPHLKRNRKIIQGRQDNSDNRIAVKSRHSVLQQPLQLMKLPFVKQTELQETDGEIEKDC